MNVNVNGELFVNNINDDSEERVNVGGGGG